MKQKKLMALALTSVMSLELLAGCSSTSSSSTGSTEGSSDSSGTTETSSTGSASSDDAVATLIANTTGTVTLKVWASEEDQTFTQGLIDQFKEKYSDVDFDIQLGSESEANAKDDILVDVEAGADVYAFADDQINELVAAGALQEVVQSYTFDVSTENVSGSIEAATVDGKLYAYPMTADNGYFMFYDSSVFTEEDVQSLDAMIEAAKAAGKQIAMEVSAGWYIYAFYKGAGFDLTLNDDGTNTCNWNDEGGTDVSQAILDLFATGVFVNMTDNEMATAITEGTICACVNGTWRAETAQEAWGENYAATKLPTFTVAGEQVQMSSFSGYKLIGVNPHSDYVGWAMLLAEYLTNYDAQIARYEARGLGPSNIEAASSETVQADPAIAALAAQAAYATPQRVGTNYWSPAATLGEILSTGNPDGTDLQEMLDTAVEGIEAAVE